MKKIFTPLGASNHSNGDRAQHDYYATDPKAVEKLLEVENFSKVIWEPCCGEGHIAKVLESHGHEVIATDLIYRGYGGNFSFDFLTDELVEFNGDIITNPPYKQATEFVQKALETNANKIAMLLKIQFLESKKRQELFKQYPPKYIYIFSERVECGKNGIFTGASAICFAWYIWEKDFKGEPTIRWI